MPQPVKTFLLEALAFQSAWTLSQENAKPRAVHQLRSTSRRLEATIALLTEFIGDVALRTASRPLQRALRKSRRKAGEVRDIDVHRELLDAYPKSRSTAALDDTLRRARSEAARELRSRLKRDRRKTQRALEKFQVAMQPALDFKLSGEKIEAFARSWFVKAVCGLDVKEDDQLHAIREASKVARYLAEHGRKASKNAAITAARFEDVQQDLGAWHDHLLLHREAVASFRPGNSLVTATESYSLKLRERAASAAKRVMKKQSKAE